MDKIIALRRKRFLDIFKKKQKLHRGAYLTKHSQQCLVMHLLEKSRTIKISDAVDNNISDKILMKKIECYKKLFALHFISKSDYLFFIKIVRKTNMKQHIACLDKNIHMSKHLKTKYWHKIND